MRKVSECCEFAVSHKDGGDLQRPKESAEASVTCEVLLAGQEGKRAKFNHCQKLCSRHSLTREKRVTEKGLQNEHHQDATYTAGGAAATVPGEVGSPRDIHLNAPRIR